MNRIFEIGSRERGHLLGIYLVLLDPSGLGRKTTNNGTNSSLGVYQKSNAESIAMISPHKFYGAHGGGENHA